MEERPPRAGSPPPRASLGAKRNPQLNLGTNLARGLQKTLAVIALFGQTFSVWICREAQTMGDKQFFFAGGGTGGHIYPAVAVANKITEIEPTAKIHFFCSARSIDTQILGRTGFEYTTLPAKGFSVRPGVLISFCSAFL